MSPLYLFITWCRCYWWISSITLVNSFVKLQSLNIIRQHQNTRNPSCPNHHHDIVDMTRLIHYYSLLKRKCTIDDDSNCNDDHHFVLENEEPLSVTFNRAVVLQRSGDHEAALEKYQFFIRAAEGCDVSPSMYAEVHVNIGAVYAKNNHNLELAKHHFELAIGYRPVGTAYVNLALLLLRKGSSIGADDPTIGMKCLEEAQSYLKSAIDLNDSDRQSKTTAVRLLEDVDVIMRQMKFR